MLLFKRAIIAEILSHAGVVFSTLIVVWLSVLLVRLLGQAAAGYIGADIVVGISAFSSITALPIILIVSLFIAILTVVSRAYREQEIFVWFTSGVSLLSWVRPVLMVAIPVALLITLLTTVSSPWAYRQIEEYRQRYEQRSDFSKAATGQFIETEGGNRVFFIEPSGDQHHLMGKLFARELNQDGISVINADYIEFYSDGSKGERFIKTGPGSRYDIKNGLPEVRASEFNATTMRIENKGETSEEQIRSNVFNQIKARPLSLLMQDNSPKSDSQIMWRFSLPIAALNLALLAIPLGSVNPRLGRSGNIIAAALVGLLYMNLLNMMRGWMGAGKVDFWVGLFAINGLIFLAMVFFFWLKIRIKKPGKRSLG